MASLNEKKKGVMTPGKGIVYTMTAEEIAERSGQALLTTKKKLEQGISGFMKSFLNRSEVVHLRVEDKTFNDKDLVALGVLLTENHYIRSIDFVSCCFTHHNLQEFFDHVHLRTTPINELSFENCISSKKMVTAIGEHGLVTAKCTLRALSLAKNSLTSDDFKELMKFVNLNDTLSYLSVAGNMIDASVSETITTFFTPEDRRMESINLRYNRFTDEEAADLATKVADSWSDYIVYF